MSHAILALLLLAPQDAKRAAEIEARVRGVIDRYFSVGTDAAARKEYARKVAAPLLACKDSGRVDEILRHLPSAAEYHQSYLGTDEFGLGDEPMPADLLKEGIDLHVEYLTVRTARAANQVWTQEKLDRVLDQIDSMFRTVREVLAEKIQGDAADERVGRTVESFRHGWRGSLLRPYNANLDSPLPEKDLQSVLQGIRERAKDFKPVTPTAEDVADDRQWAKIGAAKLVGDVVQATYKAVGFCFAEFAPMEERNKAWKTKVKAARDKAFRKDK